MAEPVEVVVAGHICLDMIPRLGALAPGALETQGRLFEVGGLRVTTGGLVANVGVTLAQLGVPVRLLATVGSDLVGLSTLESLRRVSPTLADGVRIREGAESAYTIVLARPGQDRLFLHCTGPNQTFGIEDIDFSLVEGARWFHFGYPPVLPRMFAGGGEMLEAVLQRAKTAGALTSLDFTLPDPATASGQADWPAILRRVLPFTHVFVPSLAEAVYLLRRDLYMQWDGQVFAHADRALLETLVTELLAMGPAIVGIKLGEQGVLLAGAPAHRLSAAQSVLPTLDRWADRQVWQSAYDVHVEGTTGAGDAAYGGLIAALLRGHEPEECARLFCATGAAAVESIDGLRGIPDAGKLRARFSAYGQVRPSSYQP
jgi:sugar/nucleoside kinase (ribokinase family)